MTEYAVPRDIAPGETLEQYFQHKLLTDPSFALPKGWRQTSAGQVIRDPTSGFLQNAGTVVQKAGQYGAPAIMAYGLGSLAMGGGGGAGASSTVGSGEAGSTAVPGWLTGAADASSGEAGGAGITRSLASSGIKGALAKAAGKIDWTKLALGGLSLLGGPALPYQPRETFAGKGSADPVISQQQVMDFIHQVEPELLNQAKNPTTLRSPLSLKPPEPVVVPGMQVGGAYGMDPSVGMMQDTAPVSTAPGARRRNPSNT